MERFTEGGIFENVSRGTFHVEHVGAGMVPASVVGRRRPRGFGRGRFGSGVFGLRSAQASELRSGEVRLRGFRTSVGAALGATVGGGSAPGLSGYGRRGTRTYGRGRFGSGVFGLRSAQAVKKGLKR